MHILLTTLTAFCIATLLFVFKPESTPEPGGFIQNYGEILIAAATMTSVVFAVVTYVESNIIGRKIASLRKRLAREREKNRGLLAKMLNEHRRLQYDISRRSIQCQYEIAYHNGSTSAEDWANIITSLQISEANLHLAYGSYQSIFTAMQTYWKCDESLILKHEREFRRQIKSLERSERKQLLQHLSQLKERYVERCEIANTKNT